MQYLSEPSKSKYFKLWLYNKQSGCGVKGKLRSRELLEAVAPRKIFARRNDKLIVKILRLPLASLKAKCKQIFGANKNLYRVCPFPPPPPFRPVRASASSALLSLGFFMAAGKLNSLPTTTLSKEIELAEGSLAG